MRHIHPQLPCPRIEFPRFRFLRTVVQAGGFPWEEMASPERSRGRSAPAEPSTEPCSGTLWCTSGSTACPSLSCSPTRPLVRAKLSGFFSGSDGTLGEVHPSGGMLLGSISSPLHVRVRFPVQGVPCSVRGRLPIARRRRPVVLFMPGAPTGGQWFAARSKTLFGFQDFLLLLCTWSHTAVALPARVPVPRPPFCSARCLLDVSLTFLLFFLVGCRAVFILLCIAVDLKLPGRC